MSEYGKANQKYTYKDLLALPEGLNCELVHGEIYAISPGLSAISKCTFSLRELSILTCEENLAD